MTDIVELHRQALDSTRRYVAGIEDAQWGQSTPCEGWSVRELVNHIVTGNFWAAELAAGKSIADVGDRLDGDVLGSDPVSTYGESSRQAAAAFAAPGALEAPCAVSYGPVPGSVYAGHRFIDVLIHGWDIAVATGQDTTLDPVLVSACADVVAPQAELLRGSGQFGEVAIDLGAGAGAQQRLLAVLGRKG